MVYVFGEGTQLNIVFDETVLSEEDKVKGVVFSELPEKIEKEGYDTFLNLKEDKTIEWIYVEKKKEELNEEINT
jgi:hypothetical protein